MSELSAYLLLRHCPCLSPGRLYPLLHQGLTAEAILAAGKPAWRGWGFSATAMAFLRHPQPGILDADLAWCAARPERYILTLQDSAYPPLLCEISDPPLLLYVEGDPHTLCSPQLAMVGSRHPTVQGRRTAEQFAATLAAADLTITSGLALGIDAASHQGALAVDGCSVAVVGTGLDRVYPARHNTLAHQLVQRGALVSEYPIGTGVKPGHFPRRNRIIAGLTLGTLVVEAALNSGSLITAALALDQGREVMAVPGSIHSPVSRGCHRLIRQGAKLVEEANDVLEELLPLYQFNQCATQPIAHTSGLCLSPDSALDPTQSLVLNAVEYAATSVDDIVSHTELSVEVVSGTLLILELEGLIQAESSGFSRCA